MEAPCAVVGHTRGRCLFLGSRPARRRPLRERRSPGSLPALVSTLSDETGRLLHACGGSRRTLRRRGEPLGGCGQRLDSAPAANPGRRSTAGGGEPLHSRVAAAEPPGGASRSHHSLRRQLGSHYRRFRRRQDDAHSGAGGTGYAIDGDDMAMLDRDWMGDRTAAVLPFGRRLDRVAGWPGEWMYALWSAAGVLIPADVGDAGMQAQAVGGRLSRTR